MPMMALPTYPYISANLGLYRVIRRSRVNTIPTEAFCMIASISPKLLRKARSRRWPAIAGAERRVPVFSCQRAEIAREWRAHGNAHSDNAQSCVENRLLGDAHPNSRLSHHADGGTP